MNCALTSRICAFTSLHIEDLSYGFGSQKLRIPSSKHSHALSEIHFSASVVLAVTVALARIFHRALFRFTALRRDCSESSIFPARCAAHARSILRRHVFIKLTHTQRRRKYRRLHGRKPRDRHRTCLL